MNIIKKYESNIYQYIYFLKMLLSVNESSKNTSQRKTSGPYHEVLWS